MIKFLYFIIIFIKYKKNNDKLDQLVSLNIFMKYEIESYFDDQVQKIYIKIPPKTLKVKLLNFKTKNKKLDNRNILLPSKYSGVSNIYINQSLNDSDADHIKNLNIKNSFFINIDDYILNGSVSYKQNSRDRFYRDKIFLEKDDANNMQRYSLGDIHLPSHSKLESHSTLGFSSSTINNLFKLNSNNNTNRINQYEFFIQEDSLAKLYINDEYKNSFELKAGNHNFYDLNIPQGLNIIKIVISNEYGQSDTLSFNDYKYNEILAQGVFSYGYGVGIEQYKENNEIFYNNDEIVISSIIKYGLFDNITLELGGIKQNDTFSYAYTFFLGTQYGLIHYSEVKKEIEENQSDQKNTLRYITNIFDIRINTFFEYQNKYQNNNLLERIDIFNLNINKVLTQKLTMNVNLKTLKTNNSKDVNTDLKFRYKINQKISSSLEYNKEKNDESDNSFSFLMAISYNFGDFKYRINQRNNHYDKKEFTQRTSYNISYKNKENLDIYSNIYFIDKNTESNSKSIRTKINQDKYIVDLKYEQNSNNDKSVNISLQSGLVFADNFVAMTKPIHSSFIMLNNNSTDRENIVGIKGYPISNLFAIPNNNYITQEISYDKSNLSQNYFLEGAANQYIKSNYKSGNLIQAYINQWYSLTGIIINEDNEVMAYKVFELTSVTTNQKYVTFTNQNGVFYLENLKIGKYIGKYLNQTEKTKEEYFEIIINESKEKGTAVDVQNIIIKKKV